MYIGDFVFCRFSVRGRIVGLQFDLVWGVGGVTLILLVSLLGFCLRDARM